MAAVDISIEEAVTLGAEDGVFYSHFYFPKAFRQQPAPFHPAVWKGLDSVGDRFVNMEMFRGAAKTTLLRSCISRRVAYQISRTILVVGKSESHAVRSLEWIQRAVMFNTLWAQTFGLTPGAKWAGSEIEILGPNGFSCRVIALGITGSTRGINVDDYRPDFIAVDDPLDEENTATAEQREKINDLFFGAIQNSLAPRTEAPLAKMVLLNTPLNEADLGAICKKDPKWISYTFSCFNENGESSWPSRFPTEDLVEDKESFAGRNQLHLWYREMECRITAPALASFRKTWLNFYTVNPPQPYVIISVDPTPPPREGEKPSKKVDDAVIMATAFYGGNAYVLEYYLAKSPNPLEFIYEIFNFVRRWHPRKVCVETILFQRVMAFILRQEMQKQNTYFRIEEIEDKRKKKTRIEQAITNRASNGGLYVRPDQTELIDQFSNYPNVNHDDILDALSIALTAMNPHAEGVTLEGEYVEEKAKPLVGWRSAP